MHGWMDLDDQDQERFQQQLLSFRSAQQPRILPTSPHADLHLRPTLVALIVDTNFLLSHLHFLSQLLLCLKSQSDIQIIVPFVVVQELDGLKSFNALESEHLNKDQSIAHCARQAVQFLMISLQSYPGILRGQKINEVLRQMATPDDNILDCCLYWQMHYGCKVFLLTNDKNLCVKAAVHSIMSVSNPKMNATDFLSHVRTATITGQPFDASKPIPQTPTRHSMDVDDDDAYTMTVQSTDELDNILWDLIYTVEQALNASFTILLSKAYGKNDWQKHVPQPSPWTIQDLFTILFDHENIAFTKVSFARLSMSRSQMKNLAKDLERSRRNKRALVTVGDVLPFVDALKEILVLVKDAELEQMYQDSKTVLEDVMSRLNECLSPTS